MRELMLRVMGLQRELHKEVDLLATKWEGGSALVSAGRISDMAKELAQVKHAIEEMENNARS